MGKTWPITPGLEFGKSVGCVRGKLGDFAWENNWCGFISKKSLSEFEDLGFEIKTRIPEIKWNRGCFDHLELHIDSFLDFEGDEWEKLLKTRFQACGRLDHLSADVDGMNISPSSSSSNAVIFRPRDWTTYIVVREDLAAAIRELKLTDVQLTTFPLPENVF